MAATVEKSSKPTSCLMCDTPNPDSLHLCQQCNAPLSIVQDAIAQKREPRVISILGDSNAGKTVYLGFLLDMLSQRANSFEAVPKGAYSVDLQQRVITHMSQRMFPPKTPMESNEWSWAYYQVRKKKHGGRWMDMVMPDMAGEAIAAEVTTPTTFKVIHNLLAMSTGAILLLDAALAAHGSTRPDFFGMKMMSYIDRISGTSSKRKIHVPIAVVLSKADHCPECFEDPYGFIEANLNRFWNMCQTRFSNVRVFACSVVGSLGYATSESEDYVALIPLHTALRGIMEPFEWIANQL